MNNISPTFRPRAGPLPPGGVFPPLRSGTAMKKTFPLQYEGRHPDRVLDALKHELRRYMGA
jgi:hypothetical protein